MKIKGKKEECRGVCAYVVYGSEGSDYQMGVGPRAQKPNVITLI